ncbi:unnamed protein product [Durusdinium trenchii]|uniref:EF-hand domain-containing protein n=1 Tax=Durusdinium trenchii TaxID=1381693 RepID=A0ABP0LEW4_9DINO
MRAAKENEATTAEQYSRESVRIARTTRELLKFFANAYNQFEKLEDKQIENALHGRSKSKIGLGTPAGLFTDDEHIEGGKEEHGFALMRSWASLVYTSAGCSGGQEKKQDGYGGEKIANGIRNMQKARKMGFERAHLEQRLRLGNYRGRDVRGAVRGDMEQIALLRGYTAFTLPLPMAFRPWNSSRTDLQDIERAKSVAKRRLGAQFNGDQWQTHRILRFSTYAKGRLSILERFCECGVKYKLVLLQELFLLVIQDRYAQSLMDDLDDLPHDGANLFEIIDADGSGSLGLAELVQGLLKIRGEINKSDTVAAFFVAQGQTLDGHKNYQMTH